mmetsp:Transcript_118401/g.206053  ORF Transcript_118401/g.206053 Transcript_118401/m.206053 type:complete len:231 (-) Transcript_118401:495-1187(-)
MQIPRSSHLRSKHLRKAGHILSFQGGIVEHTGRVDHTPQRWQRLQYLIQCCFQFTVLCNIACQCLHTCATRFELLPVRFSAFPWLARTGDKYQITCTLLGHPASRHQSHTRQPPCNQIRCILMEQRLIQLLWDGNDNLANMLCLLHEAEGCLKIGCVIEASHWRWCNAPCCYMLGNLHKCRFDPGVVSIDHGVQRDGLILDIPSRLVHLLCGPDASFTDLHETPTFAQKL